MATQVVSAWWPALAVTTTHGSASAPWFTTCWPCVGRTAAIVASALSKGTGTRCTCCPLRRWHCSARVQRQGHCSRLGLPWIWSWALEGVEARSEVRVTRGHRSRLSRGINFIGRVYLTVHQVCVPDRGLRVLSPQ